MAVDVSEWRMESQQKVLERLAQEQRQARLENALHEERCRFKPWDPFGKPGGGAPLIESNKRRKGPGFASSNFEPHPPEKSRVALTEEFRDPKGREEKPRLGNGKLAWQLKNNDFEGRGFLDGFGAPGSGAPLLDEDGRIITWRPTHDDLKMQANIVGKSSFLNAVPQVNRDFEKIHKYKEDLDKQYFQRVLKLNEDRKKEVELEKRTEGILGPTPPSYRPDPLQSHRKVKLHNLQPEEAETYDPWGKSMPERDEKGFVKPHLHSTYVNGVMQLAGNVDESLEYQKIKEKAAKARESHVTIGSDQRGLPVYDVKSRMDTSPVEDSFEPYDPWGRPGAGAPRRDEKGKIISIITRPPANDPVAEKQKVFMNKVYLNEIKDAMKEHQIVKHQWNEYDKAECETFAELVERSKVGKVKRDPVTGFIEGGNRMSTEITKPEVADREPQVEIPIMSKYHEDLKRQVEDRERRATLEKMKERQEAQQHYDTQNHFWGRRAPGAAPPKTIHGNHNNTVRKSHSTIYDVFNFRDPDMNTPPPAQRSMDTKLHQHSSEAQVKRINSQSRLDATLDSLYQPSGGLGFYGQGLASQMGLNNSVNNAQQYGAGNNRIVNVKQDVKQQKLNNPNHNFNRNITGNDVPVGMDKRKI